MIDPVDGKVIYPYADRMWARSVNNEVKLIRMTDNTCIFLNTIDNLYKEADLKLTDMHLHSVLFPELFFEVYPGNKRNGYARVFYEDRCWNIQTSCLYLNSKVIKEAVLPLLTFMDEHAIGVDYRMVKEYLGLNDKKVPEDLNDNGE